MSALLPKAAVTAVAALGLYAPAMGLPLPLDPCGPTVAGAAPSPTCASSERECLQANVRTGLYGVRYVLPEDVARCVEAFKACIKGGGGGVPQPPKSTRTDGNRDGLPQRFAIDVKGVLTSDCRISGDNVSCSEARRDALPEGMDSWSGEFSGTRSGMTITGTRTIRITSHVLSDPGCSKTAVGTSPLTYVVNADGTAVAREGEMTWTETGCGAGQLAPSSGGEMTVTWSPGG